MVREILEEVCLAIEEIYNVVCRTDYNAFILLIGRAEIQHGLKPLCGTDCVIEYQGDMYLNETRAKFYLDYLRKNYSREGYSYQNEDAISDITSELTIYIHIWDSEFFMKSLYRLTAIVSGKGYLWESVLPTRRIHEHFVEHVIKPLNDKGLKIGVILEKIYRSSLRNAFAHSRYVIDVERRELIIYPKSGYEHFTFDEFQQIFLYAVILMNKMENYQEQNHNAAAEKNTAITEPFFTPDGVKVQVYGILQERGDIIRPDFKMVRIMEN